MMHCSMQNVSGSPVSPGEDIGLSDFDAEDSETEKGGGECCEKFP